MSTDWADKTAEQLLGGEFPWRGVCLILGGVDTGKTTLATALAGRLAASGPVGVIDADIGQSHIGPPATVGWAIVDKPQAFVGATPCGCPGQAHGPAPTTPRGISFVGDVAPPGHLLQLTAAITQCVRQVSKVAEHIIIDTPGFIAGPAACALWWAVQRIGQPGLILAVQRENELSDIIAGMKNLGSRIERLASSPRIPAKSPQARRRYRQSQFCSYFADSCLYHLKRSDLTIQATRSPCSGRLLALRDSEDIDRAVGIMESWQQDRDSIIVRAPQIDISQIRCLVLGDVTVDLVNE
jgi:polynucleotide 5'-hydroxyl-kinase GRC3/NOL9